MGSLQEHEHRDPGIYRSESTIDRYLQVFQANVLPTWKDVFLDNVKAVQVEKWLRSLDFASGTKTKYATP